MNFGTQNNNQNKTNVNTKGIQFMNKDGFFPSTCVIGYWNDFLTVKIHPKLPKEQQTEFKIYDYEKYVMTALSVDKTNFLLEKIEDVVIPAFNEGKGKSVGIPVGADSLISVGFTKDDLKPFVAIHKGLKEDTKIPEISMFYEFNKNISVDDYDHTTGSFEVGEAENTEFSTFVKVLRSFVEGSTGAVAHSIRQANNYMNTKLATDVKGICSKLGVEPSGGRYSGNGKRSGDMFSGGQPQQNQTNEFDGAAQTETVSSLDDVF